MLLSKLVDYADRLDLPPQMYTPRTLQWFIDLDRDGRLVGFVPLEGARTRGNHGKTMLVPHRVRTSGISPLLLADNAEYVLGLPKDSQKTDRATRAHEAFVELVGLCAKETKEPEVIAALKFLERWDLRRKDLLPSELAAEDVITFRVEGCLPIHLPSVQAFWARYTASGSDSRIMTCLVCGERKPVAKRLPVMIKGIPGGQTGGTAMISANSPAFESYGLEASLVAPTCRDCGERFAQAANALLTQPETHLKVGPIVYLFWSRADAPFDPVSLLGKPEGLTVTDIDEILTGLQARVNEALTSWESGDPARVREALRTPVSARRQVLETMESSAFYATALSASGGRVVVRDWLETTIPGAIRPLRRWFHAQRLVDDRTGREGRPLGVFALAASLYRDAGEMEAAAPTVLVRSALRGDPLPLWLLERAVRRTRIERRVPRTRAALMKLVLTAQEEENMSEDWVALNLAHPDPVYHCGRLLAQLEVIQQQAVPGIRQTVVDRYYGAASTSPGAVFGVLLRNAQAHLQRLRKDRPATHTALQAELAEILSHLEDFPVALDFRRQAVFALGYYHQRAARAAAVNARRAQRLPADEPFGGVEDE